MCSKNEYTKSESNSQQASSIVTVSSDCVQRTNIQNLKAIHNQEKDNHFIMLLCSKNEYTKSESNSQLGHKRRRSKEHCVQRTNIQNLKAIHNYAEVVGGEAVIVFKERIYKI